ncbi:MAG: SDR family oxidoreductase [Gemmatimonadota bacterium]|nr:SDR family oxidoreductase [Gemmatimonadota bacterium]
MELVRRCLERGDQVIAASRSAARVTALGDLRAKYPSLELLSLDPADAASVAEAIPVLQNITSTVDLLLVAPAEAGPHEKSIETERNSQLESLSATALVEHYRRHAVAPVLIARTLLPWLAMAEQARILFVSTWLDALSDNIRDDYAMCGSSAGLHALARSLARDLANQKIIVCIGSAATYAAKAGPKPKTIRFGDVADGLLDVVDQVSLENSGALVDWNGNEHAS